jgi:hypothetical protein
MPILRHADQAVTMEIYAKASSKATQEALRRLGGVAPVSGALLYFAAVLGAWARFLVEPNRSDQAFCGRGDRI